MTAEEQKYEHLCNLPYTEVDCLFPDKSILKCYLIEKNFKQVQAKIAWTTPLGLRQSIWVDPSWLSYTK